MSHPPILAPICRIPLGDLQEFLVLRDGREVVLRIRALNKGIWDNIDVVLPVSVAFTVAAAISTAIGSGGEA